MEDGLVLEANADTPRRRQWVLILIVVDNGLVLSEFIREIGRSQVLILVVVDNGLVPAIAVLFLSSTGLNPYCSGQWSRT